MLIKNFNRNLISIFVILVLVCSGFLTVMFSNSKLNSADAATTWTQTSDEDFGSGASDNLTIEGVGEDAELQIDLSDLHHWLAESPTGTPGSRGYHAMATIYTDDKALLFGGYTGSYNDDTLEYDLSDNTWTTKNPSTKPAARRDHALASNYLNDEVLLFGGRSGWTTYEGETWIYDSGAGTWSEKTVSTNPSARSDLAMATVYGTSKAVLFGGATASGGWTFYDDTWVYDFASNSWEEKNVVGTSPSERYRHSMATIYGTDKVLLFGGSPSWNGRNDETWVYDLGDNTWTQLYPSSKPSERYGHAMAAIYNTDKVILFGGNSVEDPPIVGDTWIFDYSDTTWSQPIFRDPPISPPVRYESAMAMIDGQDKVVLSSGMRSWNTYISDTWVYTEFLPTKNGTYTSPAYDTNSNSSFDSISWNATTPADTSIQLQFRTAANESLLETKDFVGPDGKTGTFYTTPSTEIWSGHTGDRWLQYKAYLNLTIVLESPSLKYVTISYNCLPKTIIVGPTDGSLITINTPTFVWTFEDYDCQDQKAFQLLIDDDLNFTNVTFDTGVQTTEDQRWVFPTGTSFTEIPDGTWYWKVRTKDDDDTWTEFNEPWVLQIDTKLPSSSPTIPVNDGFYNSLPQISGMATDPLDGSGLLQIEVAIKRLNDNHYWDGLAWVPYPTWLLTSGTHNWTYDSSNVTWKTGTKYNVQSRAMDTGLNLEVPVSGNVFTIDMTEPTSTVKTPVEDVWLNEVTTLAGTSLDLGGSGVEKVEICIKCIRDENIWDEFPNENDCWDGNAWTADTEWLMADGLGQWEFGTSMIQWSTGNHYEIRSRAVDHTGNMEVPGVGTFFKYDSRAPEDLSIYINNGDDFAQIRNVNISLLAEDYGSGCAQMTFSTDGTAWFDWEEFNNTKLLELPVGDSEKRVYFKVIDHAGNIADSVSDTIILDSTPPEALSIIINDNSKYTNSNIFILSLDAFDSLSGVSDMALSFDGTAWLAWEPFKESRTISISTEHGDGEKYIYFRVIDKAGNIARPESDSIILDTTPPHSLSNIINDGANETNQTTVWLKLDAFDALSGVYQISLSLDNETWSTWDAYGDTRTYLLPAGDGVKTVYFKVKDLAGNIAGPVNGTILLNTVKPDSVIEVQAPEKAESSESNWNSLIILFLIIIIIIILITLAIVTKRKKRTDSESLPAGAMTIKPGGLSAPVISYDQVPSTLRVAALTRTATGTPGQAVPVQVPMLAKSTYTGGVIAQQQHAPPQAPQNLPQLPPARLPETKPEVTEPAAAPVATTQASQPTVPTPTPAQTRLAQVMQASPPTVSKPTSAAPTTPAPVTPSPGPKPQAVTTPKVASAPSQTTGPAVHLPGAAPTPAPSTTPPGQVKTNAAQVAQTPAGSIPTQNVIQQKKKENI